METNNWEDSLSLYLARRAVFKIEVLKVSSVIHFFPPNRSNFFHVNVGREVDVWRKEIDLIKFEVDVWNFKLWYLELRDVKFQVRTLTFDVHVIKILQRHLKS